jgi:hypothetical protein
MAPVTTQEAQAANGSPPADPGYLSADAALANAPADLEEVDVDDVFGGRVRIRALTAAQTAVVRQHTVDTRGKNPQITWADMERKQFQLGVIMPAFNADQVRTLHATSGRSFARVIAEIDRISALDKEALRDAQKDFPGPDER